MPIEHIFPVVIADADDALLELTLANLREFDEVIVHAQKGTDDLVALCASYSNTHLVVRADLVGGRARNHGASVAAGEWILALSAGEFPSDGLLANLKELALDEPDRVYAMAQRRLFLGQPMRWGGWRPTWPTRLYNRHRYQFYETPLDEQLALAGDTRRRVLKGTVWLEMIVSIDDLLRETARRARLRRHWQPPQYSAPGAAMRSLWTFLKSFVLHLGFLDGRRGLIVAVAVGVETFFATVARPDRSRGAKSTGTFSSRQTR